MYLNQGNIECSKYENVPMLDYFRSHSRFLHLSNAGQTYTKEITLFDMRYFYRYGMNY